MQPATMTPVPPPSPIARIADVFILTFGFAAMIAVLYLALQELTGHDARGAIALEEYDATAPVVCGSRSMGLVLRCNDTLLLREVNPKDRLREGHIYTYHFENRSIVHRYLTSTDNGTTVLMKGDNNRVPERIPRTAITYEVIGAYYDTT